MAPQEEPIMKSTMVQMPESPAHLNDLRETISHLQKRVETGQRASPQEILFDLRLLLEGWEKGFPQWIPTEQMLMDEPRPGS